MSMLGGLWPLIASREGSAKALTILLRDERVDPNCVDIHGSTALDLAAVQGDASVAALLLADERVDPNNVNGQVHGTRQRRRVGPRQVATLLLADKRVDPNVENKYIHGPVQCDSVEVSLSGCASAGERPRGPQHRRQGWHHASHARR